VTGDITQVEGARTVFFRGGEKIHDFKDIPNLEDAVGFLRAQDQQLADHSDEVKDS